MTRLPIVDYKAMDKVLRELGLNECGRREAMSFTVILTEEPRPSPTTPGRDLAVH